MQKPLHYFPWIKGTLLVSGFLWCGTGLYAQELNLLAEAMPLEGNKSEISELLAIRVSGTITDVNGEPLPGASVLVEGTTLGTVTDMNGEYGIEVPEDGTLIISYIGFETRKVAVNNRSVIDVSLKEDLSSLEEVIVVGYGTQKKANLTGSVATVDSEVLMERPAPNAGNLLQGRMAGLQVTQPTGQPGRDNPNLSIRGMGSFGASAQPLVLVDGIIGSINNLAPDDIENVTVLKDAASASIYGARAANGVILVTTKKGKKGPLQVNYRFDAGVSEATRLPDFIYDSGTYMKMWNQAMERNGQPLIYTQEQIDTHKNATDRDLYPNFNWVDHYFNPALTMNHSLRMSGGTDKTTYNLSLGYLDQDGVLPNNDYKRYNGLLSLTSQVSDVVRIGATLNMVHKNIDEPWFSNDALVLLVYQAGPTYKPYLPDGSGRVASRGYPLEGHNRGPAAVFDNGGRNAKEYAMNAQAYMDVNLTKGLIWSIKGGVNYADNFSKSHQYPVNSYVYVRAPGEEEFRFDNDGWPSNLGVTDRYDKNILLTMYSTLDYNKTFDEVHNLNAMLGYEQQSFNSRFLQGRRIDFPLASLKEINAGAAQGQSVSGSANEYALQSVFARLAYDYREKYLVELNSRYDGTSRVSPDNRWGFFPSFSLGWRMSEEDFFKNSVAFVDDLKWRASFGTLGNQEIGNYPYQNILSLTAYPFGSTLDQGVQLRRLNDPSLRWEQTEVLDFGVDVELFEGKLGATFDWYKKTTSGILTSQPVPGSVGLSGPITNDGILENRGLELELRHRNKIGEVDVSANAVIAGFKNEVKHIRNPVKGQREVGLPYNSLYMYEWIGIFQSEEEIANSPEQVFFEPSPGDLKIKDQNGDGVVDAEDRVSYSPFPDFSYSLGLNAGWKRFNLSIFFQGVEGQNLRVSNWGIDPFHQGSPPTTKFLNAWTPDNPSQTVPAVYAQGYPGVSAYNSTYYLQDASYLRLKNVNLSYSIPEELAERLKMRRMTVYVSGDNLLTFTKYEGADPERAGNGNFAQFPQVRIFNAGVNLTF